MFTYQRSRLPRRVPSQALHGRHAQEDLAVPRGCASVKKLLIQAAWNLNTILVEGKKNIVCTAISVGN
jgi:hypothetical protein